MDTARFTSKTFGTVVKTPGRYGFHTFLPARLPRSLVLSPETVTRLSEADRALGPRERVGCYRTRICS